MKTQSLREFRLELSGKALMPEAEAMEVLTAAVKPIAEKQPSVFSDAAFLLKRTRAIKPSSLEQLLQHFSLESLQGIELMRLMEALPRIPDTETANALIHEVFAKPCWQEESPTKSHLLGNLADAGLKFAHQMMGAPSNMLQRKMKDLSTPLFSKVLKNMSGVMGSGFVLAETIEKAIQATAKKEAFLYSFDMLGEAAKTTLQADRYFKRYLTAIEATAVQNDKEYIYRNSISVKLSALYPRFELTHRKGVMAYLYPKLKTLALAAKKANLLLTIDAEEARRFDLTLELYEMLLLDEDLAGFNGIGLAIQAYQKRAFYAINYLLTLAEQTNRKLPIRLVKGAYWDSEIKHAQGLGLTEYPVFTHKAHSDISYLACAKKMLDCGNSFWPQFATHNTHTIAAILRYATPKHHFEFQKLHGMGDRLFAILKDDYLCRIYAPIGSHETLLPYLIRRLLENGANTSFLHQFANEDDDQKLLALPMVTTSPSLPLPTKIYGQERKNSNGLDLGILQDLQALKLSLAPLSTKHWQATPIINGEEIKTGQIAHIASPSNIHSISGTCHYATEMEIMKALTLAQGGFANWHKTDVETRAKALEKAAELLEINKAEALALLVYEASKTLPDGLNEIRETIDFLRYYAAQARQMFKPMTLPAITGETNILNWRARGVFLCISPWNFPLAIFTGQIAASLAAGNTVIAKPAEQTPLIASFMTKLLLKSGIPPYALQLLTGSGATVGQRLVTSPQIAGVVFTGSSTTAQNIQMTLAKRTNGIIPLIAETGGQNAMVMDSSTLSEQAADDILQSAFGSAGQRCSALRVLYIPEHIADDVIALLKGAAEHLSIGFPEDLDTDIPSVINPEAQQRILKHIEHHKSRVLFQVPVPALAARKGCYVPPTAIAISSITDLKEEVFGPVLHIVRYDWKQIDSVIRDINATHYALTFGIHSRLESRISHLTQNIEAGNIYINRSMIGAVVGQQPFGGHGLSGTGFKAGGKHYLTRFATEIVTTTNTAAMGGNVKLLSGE